TFRALRGVRPGFAGAVELQTMRISIPGLQVQDPEAVTRMQQAIADKLAAIPGVSSVAFGSSVPMEGVMSADPLFTEDKAYPAGQDPIRRYKYVSPGFLQTMQTRLIAGREFTWTDLYDQRPVAMVSENTARELWGDATAAIGKRVRPPGPPGPWREIIGVTEDVRDSGVQQSPPTIVYWPTMTQNFFGNPVNVIRSVAFVIRSRRTGNEAFLNEVRSAVWSVNQNLPLAGVRSMDDIYDRSIASTSFTL